MSSKINRKNPSSAFHATGLGTLEARQDIRDLTEDVQVAPKESLRFRRLKHYGFYVVKSGLLKLQLLRPAPRILRLCTSGDWAGYGSWLMTASENYRLTAIEPSVVQFWSQEAAQLMKSSSPDFNERVITHLVQNLLHKDERIAILETQSAEARFAQLLLWLSTRFGSGAEGGRLIDISLDREEFAQLSGTSAVTIARIITQLEDRGVLRRRRRKLLITDPGALRALASPPESGA